MYGVTLVTTPPLEEARELLALDVDEVSMVGKAAIRRKFSVIKSLEEEEDVATKKVNKGEITEDVKKAATPMLTALASERLGLIGSKVKEIQDGLGTMAKKDVNEAMYALHDLIWSAQTDVIAISKAVDGDAGELVEKLIAKQLTEVEKAHPRKMTKRRLDSMKAALTTLADLAKEFETETEEEEDEDMPTETKVEKTDTTAPVAPVVDTAVITAAVTKAVGEATAPLVERIEKLEKAAPAEPAKVDTKVEKSEEEAPAWAKKIQKGLDDLGQRLDTVEASSNAAGGNRTETKETKKSEKGLWDDIGIG